MIVKSVETISAPNFTWVIVSYDDGKVRPKGAALPSVRFCAFRNDNRTVALERHHSVQSGEDNELLGTSFLNMTEAKKAAADYVEAMGEPVICGHGWTVENCAVCHPKKKFSKAVQSFQNVARQRRLDAEAAWSRKSSTLPQLELF